MNLNREGPTVIISVKIRFVRFFDDSGPFLYHYDFFDIKIAIFLNIET